MLVTVDEGGKRSNRQEDARARKSLDIDKSRRGVRAMSLVNN